MSFLFNLTYADAIDLSLRYAADLFFYTAIFICDLNCISWCVAYRLFFLWSMEFI
jgi:hypothetical protein